jgi:hypothetical protein
MSFSLNEKTIRDIVNSAGPASQFTSLPDVNLGFGLLYYALGRLYRPRKMLVIGSRRTFSLVCFALAMKDNDNQGTLYFVDTGFPDEPDGFGGPMNGGCGGDEDETKPVTELLTAFAIDSIVKRFVMEPGKFFDFYESYGVADIDTAFIDGDHSFEGFRHDFERAAGVVKKGGLLMFHDALVDESNSPLLGRYFGVSQVVETCLRGNPRFELLTLPVFPGLGIARRV